MTDPFDNMPTARLPIRPGDLLAALSSSSAAGPDPRRLAYYVADAMNGWDDVAEGEAVVLPAPLQAAFEAARDAARPYLRALLKVGGDIAPGEVGHDGVRTKKHPWAAVADHMFAAALLEVAPSGGRTAAMSAADLAQAGRLIAGLSAPPTVKKPPGPAPQRDTAYRIVRAVCGYRHEMGFSIDCRWSSFRDADAVKGSPRQDREMIPKSETAELIHDVAKALRADVSHASLEAAHKTFLSELGSRAIEPIPVDRIVN